MQLNGKYLCDFCFSTIEEDGVCRNCGITHDTYRIEPGLLKPGTNLQGKYIIGRLLGRGGFGATYVAYSANLNKPVAIKEFFPMGISYRETDGEKISVISAEKQAIYNKGMTRFYEEARNAYLFANNPNIVTVYEFFYANSTAYYSMDYLEGIDLKKYVSSQGGKLSEEETVRIVDKIANALSEMHYNKVLHRDVSPDNVFICNNGEVKLIDFGASKQFIAEAQAGFSAVIKHGFAPVEQYSKNGIQGAWTDIYALGATMYYMLTGSAPNDALERQTNPQLYIDIIGESSQRLLYIINRCMQHRFEDRYQSIIDLKADLSDVRFTDNFTPNPPINNYNQQPFNYNYMNVKPPKVKKQKVRKKSHKNPLAIVLSIMLVCVLAIGAYYVLVINPPSKRFKIEESHDDVVQIESDVETVVDGSYESEQETQQPKQSQNKKTTSSKPAESIQPSQPAQSVIKSKSVESGNPSTTTQTVTSKPVAGSTTTTTVVQQPSVETTPDAGKSADSTKDTGNDNDLGGGKGE